jgi:hypothetical protein
VTYHYSNEAMEHRVGLSLSPIYNRDHPPPWAHIAYSASFAVDMNSDAVRHLLDALSATDLDQPTFKVALHTHTQEEAE